MPKRPKGRTRAMGVGRWSGQKSLSRFPHSCKKPAETRSLQGVRRSGKPIRKNKEEGGRKKGKKEGKREVKARGEKKRSKSKTMRTRYKWVEGTQDLMVAG